jgi:elongation factor G|nr:elongation factor G [Kofleriaceae bacterium]
MSRLDARSVPLAKTRNIGIMAHVDAGKTTTTERILFYTGVTSRIGEVDDGAAFTDWMQQEQERGISITAAATTFGWRGHVVNLIDTPGHVDFTMEVERSLRVLDGAIAVFDAVAGVEPQSETVWRQADRHRIPRVAFINKCDRVGADPARTMADMRTRLGASPIAVQLAMGLGAELAGIVDLVAMRARTWDATSFGRVFSDGPIPHAHAADASRARELMIEAIAELDDELMAAWVAGRELPADLVRAALRRITLAGRGVPVLVGSAFKNLGIHDLLDAVVDYLPSPADANLGRSAADGQRAASLDDAPLTALAFKVHYDEAGSQLTYVRVYSGCLRAGESVGIVRGGGDPAGEPTTSHLEQVGRLVRMYANHREDIKQIEAGMIGALVKPPSSTKIATGDTLCDPRFPVALESIAVPLAVIGVTVEPETADDHARLLVALERLAIEDPSFRVRIDVETGRIVIAGMGELHLEILVDRLRRELGVQARVGQPQVSYRETITRRAEGENRFLRVAGPRSDYGHVRLVVEPTDRGGGYVYENHAPDSDIPREHAPAVEEGITEAAQRGVLAGCPMTDLRVQVVGGSYHPVDSNHYAFKVAGSKAFVAAANKASPTLLEPVMSLEVVTPDDYVGDVLGDLHARRGKVAGITARPGVQTVACFVPMASMFGYATDLRSRTKGRATHSMELDHYAEVPQQIRDEMTSRSIY